LKDCALISKYAGGIAVNIHNIRAKNSFIRGTNGTSNGIVPMLRVFNNVSLYCDQGGGKRKGSIVAYLEPWHADVCDFLFMKKNHGDEYLKARELFYAMWVPDLFMQRLLDDKDWSLFCPDECPGLADTYGDEFAALYTKYETEGKHRGKIQARELWFKILDAQMETGMPYLLFKDAANKKSNQKNIGTIKSSNLCCEIMEYSDATETAVCNLASIALPRFVNPQTRQFNYAMLHDVTKTVAFNLNRIIDITYYPTDKAKKSNVRHRPIGIGVQGLADMFILMNIAFHSDEAKTVNRLVFETIYHAALEQSSEQAEIDGPYETFHGSPASQGVLQYDMWGVVPTPNRYDWDALKERIKRDGLRNSLLVSLMPTASTSQILGYNECFEPFTANIYSRRVLAGEYTVVNKYMMRELQSLGMWSEDIKQSIIANNGSIQHLTILPEHVRNKYKTVWEIPMRHIIQMSVDRGAFICQSQSLNLWMEEPNYAKLTSMHIFSWKAGLKTGVYYMRRRAKYTAQQFTVEPVCTECSA